MFSNLALVTQPHGGGGVNENTVILTILDDASEGQLVPRFYWLLLLINTSAKITPTQTQRSFFTIQH